MHIKTIDNFLVCCALKTGGYVLGYLGTVVSTLVTVLLIRSTVLNAVSYVNLQDEVDISFLEHFPIREN